MKVISLYPSNTYSCMNCKTQFETLSERTVLWFCGESCKYKFAFSVVNSVYPKADKVKVFTLSKKIAEVSLK